MLFNNDKKYTKKNSKFTNFLIANDVSHDHNHTHFQRFFINLRGVNM